MFIFLTEGNGWNILSHGSSDATTSVADPADGTASVPGPENDGDHITAADGADVSEPNAVGSLPLALWWSFTTVVTGGFGDIYNPESSSGQMLTAILVIMGMVLVGVFTATLTSLYVGEQAEEIERLQEDLGDRLDQISRRLDQLESPDS